jgi:hypothetical protein
LRNEGETTRGSVSVSLRVEGKSGSRAAVSFRVEGKSGSRAARRFWFRFVSSGARFRETGFDFLVLSVTLARGSHRGFDARNKIGRFYP